MSITRAVALGLVLAGAGCSPIVSTHGYVPDLEDLDALRIGVDRREDVAEAVGSPAATGLIDGNSWFYVASTVSAWGPMAPQVTERQVIALDFNAKGVLRGINRYGLEDGRVINLQSRITPTETRRRSVLGQLLGNVGSVGMAAPR